MRNGGLCRRVIAARRDHMDRIALCTNCPLTPALSPDGVEGEAAGRCGNLRQFAVACGICSEFFSEPGFTASKPGHPRPASTIKARGDARATPFDHASAVCR